MAKKSKKKIPKRKPPVKKRTVKTFKKPKRIPTRKPIRRKPATRRRVAKRAIKRKPPVSKPYSKQFSQKFKYGKLFKIDKRRLPKKKGRYVFDMEVTANKGRKKVKFSKKGVGLPRKIDRFGWSEKVDATVFNMVKEGNAYIKYGRRDKRFRFSYRKPLSNVKVKIRIRKVK